MLPDGEGSPGSAGRPVRVRLTVEDEGVVDPLVAVVLLRLALWARAGRPVDGMALVELVAAVVAEVAGDVDRALP